MAKPAQKTQKMGYGLDINRSGEKGAANWERVGFLFKSRSEANAYRDRHHPSAKASRIYGIKISVEPVSGSAGRSSSQERA